MATQSLPITMRAWTYTRRGSPSSILTLTDLPLPITSTTQLKPTQLLIKVSYVGLNGGSAAILNVMPHFTPKPKVPEMDFSGVVVATGSNHSGFSVDDAVCGAQMSELLKGDGMLCEYVIVNADTVIKKPETMGMAASAGLAACGMTSVQCVNYVGLKRGQRVLITAGSGGLGVLLVQVARAVVGEEGRVVATCSGRNREMVMGLGADEVIDYTVRKDLSQYCTEHFSEEPFDVIFDIVGDYKLHKECPSYLKKDGHFLLLGDMASLVKSEGFSFWEIIMFILWGKTQWLRPVWLGGVPRKHWTLNGGQKLDDLKRMARMVDDQGMKIPVDSVWEMDDVKKAYEKLVTQRARGKITIKVDPEAQP